MVARQLIYRRLRLALLCVLLGIGSAIGLFIGCNNSPSANARSIPTLHLETITFRGTEIESGLYFTEYENVNLALRSPEGRVKEEFLRKASPDAVTQVESPNIACVAFFKGIEANREWAVCGVDLFQYDGKNLECRLPAQQFRMLTPDFGVQQLAVVATVKNAAQSEVDCRITLVPIGQSMHYVETDAAAYGPLEFHGSYRVSEASE
jgi:hypothetical protein